MAKELYDQKQGGPFDRYDLLADGLGVAAGVSLMVEF